MEQHVPTFVEVMGYWLTHWAWSVLVSWTIISVVMKKAWPLAKEAFWYARLAFLAASCFLTMPIAMETLYKGLAPKNMFVSAAIAALVGAYYIIRGLLLNRPLLLPSMTFLLPTTRRKRWPKQRIGTGAPGIR